jgi:dienelactone hydrolase
MHKKVNGKGWALLTGACLVGLASRAEAKLQTQFVEYKEGDTVLQGYLAYDDAINPSGSATNASPATNTKKPGVLVIHAWTGLGEYVQKRAEQLAGMGYVAFAPDIYGKGVRPANPKDAGATASIYRNDRALLRRRAQAGLKVLQEQPNVDSNRIAAMGYCFGGGAALELARSAAPIVGAVSFHGNLDTPNPEDAKNIKGKVLVLHGAVDPHVPPTQVAAFVEEMENAKIDYQIVAYGGAVHSFTEPAAGNDPSDGSAYDAAADRRSWQAMHDFFSEIFALPAKNAG